MAEWVLAFQEGALKTSALEELTKIWAENSPESAEAWIKNLPGGAERDSASAAYSQKVVTANPLSAAQWAAGISQPELRQQEITKVLSVWLKADEKAAREWMAASGQPPPKEPLP